MEFTKDGTSWKVDEYGKLWFWADITQCVNLKPRWVEWLYLTVAG